jgi:ATP synthase protein I
MGTRGVRGPQGPWVEMARFSGHGLNLALSTALFLLLGWWVDGKLGSRPLFTVIGALVGAAAGFYSLLQHVLFRPRDRGGPEEAPDAPEKPRQEP